MYIVPYVLLPIDMGYSRSPHQTKTIAIRLHMFHVIAYILLFSRVCRHYCCCRQAGSSASPRLIWRFTIGSWHVGSSDYQLLCRQLPCGCVLCANSTACGGGAPAHPAATAGIDKEFGAQQLSTFDGGVTAYRISSCALIFFRPQLSLGICLQTKLLSVDNYCLKNLCN